MKEYAFSLLIAAMFTALYFMPIATIAAAVQ
jgi:hypothetical protein